MFVSALKLYNFRQFKSDGNNPGLDITFHTGLNALIGENDSGKTAIIDAIKLVLLTQSNEYIRPTDEDFYISSDGTSVSEFIIECTLDGFSQNEAKNFVEYLSFTKTDGNISYSMNLYYRAWKEKNRIYSELRVGSLDDGVVLDGKARDLLRAVYLKPLRDAEREMSSGRNSRISQILMGHPVFQNKDAHKLREIMREANSSIEKYFSEDDGKEILQTIRQNLNDFNVQDSATTASFLTSDIQLKTILESLSLNVSDIHPGLGELNLLFMAAELLLLKHDDNGGLKLALIEELEAHLHPQAQLRLINFLQNEYNESGSQIIISTHSPILASKINIKNIILLKDGCGYDLSYTKTGLERGDYLFLQRFLDVTKSNLFFAKGIIMVEGDAENILVPVIAEILGYPLERYGVSIVNVGSTAFLRYSRIMMRSDGTTVPIPVSIITDCDVKPYEKDNKEMVFPDKSEEYAEAIKKKMERYDIGTIKSYVSPKWTLEYCLALSCLEDEFHKAIHYGKKIKNSNKYSLTNKKIQEADTAATQETTEWAGLSTDEKATRMYSLMLDNDDKSGLKAIVAQCMASILRWECLEDPQYDKKENLFDIDLFQFKVSNEKISTLKEKIEEDESLRYIASAIKHAVGVES